MKERTIQRDMINTFWRRGWKGWQGDWPLAEKAEEAYLRLERRDGGFQPFLSADGTQWTPLYGPLGLRGSPAKLTIGLAAYSTSTERAQVRFDQFKFFCGARK
jgi:hypothetical protein